MNIKITYGQSILVNLSNAPKSGTIHVVFHNCVCITEADAINLLQKNEVLDLTDVVIDQVVSSNEEVVSLINSLSNVGFIVKADTIDLYDYCAETDCHDRLDVSLIKASTGFESVYVHRYHIENSSSLAKIKTLRGKTLVSKKWNTAGEIVVDEDILLVKRQLPVEFKELKDLVYLICPTLTDKDYLDILKETTIKSDTFFGEESWRDFSWYEIRIVEIEKKLNEMGYLKPFLRTVTLKNLLPSLI